MKGRPGVLAKIVPELLESQDKEGKMWDFLLLLPGAKKQPNHLERDPCPRGAAMRGRGESHGKLRSVCYQGAWHTVSTRGSTGHRRRLSLSRDVLKKKTGH